MTHREDSRDEWSVNEILGAKKAELRHGQESNELSQTKESKKS